MTKAAEAAAVVEVAGLRLSLARPRIVAATSRGRCWYPDLLAFSGGELMLNHSVNADANESDANAQAVYLSSDGGRTFPFAYDVNGFHNGGGEPRISLPDGRIVGASTFLRPEPAGQGRRFTAHRWTYDRGGRRYAVEPWGALVEGLPGEVEPWPTPSRTWWSRINWFSDIVALRGGGWLSTLSMRFAGDALETTVALGTADEGRTWRYLSTIAGPADTPGASEGFDEPCLVELADGEVMCISRVGSGAEQKLARTYSGDGGRSWSKLERLEAYSVAPQAVRTRGGVLALSTGRPGLFLWLSSDARGRRWRSVDVMAHHNASVEPRWQMTAEQTTAYTALLEAEAGRLLLAYDRTQLGWQAVEAGSGEQSQIWLLEVRVG